MASTGLQVLALLLAVLGWVCGALVCAAPLWRVSAFVGGELVIAQVLWEGLWMNCLSQTTGHIQCKTYDSTLALPTSAQAARGLTVLSLLLCLLALMLGIAGAKCTHCMGDGKQSSKARLGRIAGVLFIVAALAYLVPICWTAYSVIRDFYDPNVAAPLKRELGPALYLGWGASVMLLVGGFCCMSAPLHLYLEQHQFLEERQRTTRLQRRQEKQSSRKNLLYETMCTLFIRHRDDHSLIGQGCGSETQRM